MTPSDPQWPFHPTPNAPPQLQPREVRGPNFTYVLPPGWTVGEEGQQALVLRSPDLAAGIVVVGQIGLMAPMSPEQFAYYEMTSVLRLAPDVRIANARPIQPMPGCTNAMVMETTYTIQGPNGFVLIRGVVVSNVTIGYGFCNGVIAIAGAASQQWPAYQNWLPQVAMAAYNCGPNPYGSTAMAGTMHGIASRDGAAYASYRAWSQSIWAAVTAERADSQDRQQAAMGPMLTGQEWLPDPYGNQPLRRSTTPAVIWRSFDGREVASEDPSFDPRTPMDSDWRRVR